MNQTGKDSEARVLYRTTLAAQEQEDCGLGADHPATLATVRALALLLHDAFVARHFAP